MCLGEDRVPVFKDLEGLSMPVGYRLCECVGGGLRAPLSPPSEST